MHGFVIGTRTARELAVTVSEYSFLESVGGAKALVGSPGWGFTLLPWRFANRLLLGATLALNKLLFIHRHLKFNKLVQETQKQYAYLSVTYRQNDNYRHLRWQDGKLLSKSQRQQNKDQNQNKQTKQNKTRTKREAGGGKKQITNRMV